mgnify:CR=1
MVAKPVDISLDMDYTFYIVWTTLRNSKFISTAKSLIVGCTSSQNMQDDILFDISKDI